MATVTLGYNPQLISAQKLLEGILSTGIFEIIDIKQENPYNVEFCKKMDESIAQMKEGKCKAIKTEDLWK